MKNFSLVICTLLLTRVFAQYDIAPIAGNQLLYSADYFQQQNQREKESLQKNKVQSRTVLHYTGDTRTKTIETYDALGNITSYNHFNKKEENTVSCSYTYDSEERPVQYNYRNGKKNSWQRIEYDDSGLLKRSSGYNSKGEFFGREEFKRDDGKMLAITIWVNDSLSPYKRLDYEYYDDGSLKKIQYFFKSKLKYTWTYDCKPEGELQGTKQKDSTLICVKEEYDSNGNRVVWKQEFNRKGDLVKTKMVYEKDSSLVLIETYDGAERLSSQRTFFKDGGELFFSYDEKGKIHYTTESIYNINKQLVKRSSAYGRNFYNSWYSYEGDLVKSKTTLNRYQASFSEYSYSYFE